MKMILYEYTCDSCGQHYQAPKLFNEPYGYLLLRSKQDELAYVDIDNDSVVDEVSHIIKNHPIGKMAEYKADIFADIFQFACDLAPDGSRYSELKQPNCPNCKSHDPRNLEPVHPAQFIELDLKHVTHNHWNSLSQKEKEDIMDKPIRKFLEEHPGRLKY